MDGPPGFDQFVRQSSPRLLRTAVLLTGDPALAEDLLQVSYAKAWAAWDRIETDPQAYMRRILVTTQTSWWRRKWRGETATVELPELLNVPDSEADRAVTAQDLAGALRRLPTRQRAVVVLRFFDDMSEADTAYALGLSVGTVKSHTSRALKALRLDASLADSYPRVREVATTLDPAGKRDPATVANPSALPGPTGAAMPTEVLS